MAFKKRHHADHAEGHGWLGGVATSLRIVLTSFAACFFLAGPETSAAAFLAIARMGKVRRLRGSWGACGTGAMHTGTAHHGGCAREAPNACTTHSVPDRTRDGA